MCADLKSQHKNVQKYLYISFEFKEKMLYSPLNPLTITWGGGRFRHIQPHKFLTYAQCVKFHFHKSLLFHFVHKVDLSSKNSVSIHTISIHKTLPLHSVPNHSSSEIFLAPIDSHTAPINLFHVPSTVLLYIFLTNLSSVILF